MLMNPQKFKDLIKDENLSELIRTRDELIDWIRDYEESKRKGYDVVMTPDPEIFYKYNHLYLIEVCRLICENADGEVLDLTEISEE